MNGTETAELRWQIEVTETERQLIAWAVCSAVNTERHRELSVPDQVALRKLATRFDR